MDRRGAFDSTLPSKRFKIILIGDSGVGKSSILFRFNKGYYDDSIESTIGVAYNSQNMWIDEASTNIVLDLWDTAGQERFDAIIPRYFRGAQGILVVFDMSSYKTIESVRKRWLEKIKIHSLDGDPIIVIVGNKNDLVDPEDQRRLSAILEDLADKYREELRLPVLTYLSSAKSGENVSKIFEEITRKIYRQYTHPNPTIGLEDEYIKEKTCCI